jgi:hypothetical protein
MNLKSGGETQNPTPDRGNFGKLRLISVHRKHQHPQGQAACAIFTQQSLLWRHVKPIYTYQLRETGTMRVGQAGLKKVHNFCGTSCAPWC